MFRKLVLGIAASAALGLGLLASGQPAAAQSWSVTIGSGHGSYGPAHGFYRPVRDEWGYRGGWGHGPRHGGWGPPPHARGYWHGGPRCHVRHVRYWDGWGWAVERRRVCH